MVKKAQKSFVQLHENMGKNKYVVYYYRKLASGKGYASRPIGNVEKVAQGYWKVYTNKRGWHQKLYPSREVAVKTVMKYAGVKL